MATLAKQPNVRRVRVKSGGSQKKWWLAVLWLAAFVSSALGLVVAVALLVYINPQRADQIVAVAYRYQQWNGPDWISYTKFGMFAAPVLGAIGLVLCVAGMVLAARRVKDQTSSDWGRVVLGFGATALVFALLLDAMILSSPILP